MFGLRKKKNTASSAADEKPKWQQEIQNLEDDDKILKNLEELPLESLNEPEDDVDAAQKEQKVDMVGTNKDKEERIQEDTTDDKVKKNEGKVGSNGEGEEEEGEPEFLGEEEGA